MKNIRNQRFREAVTYLKDSGRVYNYSDLYNKLGKNKSQMSDVICGRRPVTRELAELLCEHFPEINIDYIMDSAEQVMIKKITTPVTGDGNNVNNGRDQNINTTADVERLLVIIEKQQEQIETLINLLALK